MIKKKSPKIFIISAPSGGGKTTLCHKLLANDPALADSISMTTRPPRPGEKDGLDYIFTEDAHFRDEIKKGGFLEYEENFGYLYGTPKDFVENNLRKGRSVLLSIDVKGAMKVRRAYPDRSVLIFILPPSISELKKRLALRKSDSPEVIAGRLKLAKEELSYKSKFDYKVVNDNLEKAYRRLKDIIYKETKRG